mmetsp:Transcript_56351/g.134509  ORF Transcript_56351/g.134509 Transcript_56351/m.134509 type:complete len:290 (-) Transcript_56351:3282-4151(-)
MAAVKSLLAGIVGNWQWPDPLHTRTLHPLSRLSAHQCAVGREELPPKCIEQGLGRWPQTVQKRELDHGALALRGSGSSNDYPRAVNPQANLQALGHLILELVLPAIHGRPSNCWEMHRGRDRWVELGWHPGVKAGPYVVIHVHRPNAVKAQAGVNRIASRPSRHIKGPSLDVESIGPAPAGDHLLSSCHHTKVREIRRKIIAISTNLPACEGSAVLCHHFEPVRPLCHVEHYHPIPGEACKAQVLLIAFDIPDNGTFGHGQLDGRQHRRHVALLQARGQVQHINVLAWS